MESTTEPSDPDEGTTEPSDPEEESKQLAPEVLAGSEPCKPAEDRRDRAGGFRRLRGWAFTAASLAALALIWRFTAAHERPVGLHMLSLEELVSAAEARARTLDHSRSFADQVLEQGSRELERGGHPRPAPPGGAATGGFGEIVGSVEEQVQAARIQAANNREWEEATCFINVLIATEKLSLAGLQIEESVYKCKPEKSRAACATDIAGVYASFAAAVSYLSAAAAACPAVRPEGAECSADMADIQYGLGTMASALATINDVCKPGVTSEVKDIAPNRRGPTTGMCVVNVAQAAAYIGHAVLSMRGAITDCPPEKNLTAACSAQVSGIAQSFLLIAAYLSNAATQCGRTIIVAAECSNRVTSVLAGMAEVSAGGSAAADDCTGNRPNKTIRPR